MMERQSFETELARLDAALVPQQQTSTDLVLRIDNLRSLHEQRTKLLKHYAVMARNGYVAKAIETDFQKELQDAAEDSSSSSSSSTMKKNHHSKSNNIKLHVFGTSAKEYETMIKDVDGDAGTSGCFFDHLETGTPAVMDFLAEHAGFQSEAERNSLMVANALDRQCQMQEHAKRHDSGEGTMAAAATDAELEALLGSLLQEPPTTASSTSTLELDQRAADRVAQQERAAMSVLVADAALSSSSSSSSSSSNNPNAKDNKDNSSSSSRPRFAHGRQA